MKDTIGVPLLCWSTGGWKVGFNYRVEEVCLFHHVVCSSRCEFKMALMSSCHMP